jgi:hypothetical protein
MVNFHCEFHALPSDVTDELTQRIATEHVRAERSPTLGLIHLPRLVIPVSVVVVYALGFGAGIVADVTLAVTLIANKIYAALLAARLPCFEWHLAFPNHDSINGC